MTVTNTEKLEDCLDGSMIYRIVFGKILLEKELGRLSELGEWEYYGDFPKPFFRLHREGDFQVKGVAGERDARLILFAGNPGRAVDMISDALNEER